MKETMNKYRFFSIVDFEQEEQFLQEMASKGYHLERIDWILRYVFVKGEPKEVTYRLDLRNNNAEKEELIQMAQDYGWTYLTQMMDWVYFRKDGKGHELFTDQASKIQYLNRIFVNRYLLVFIMFLLIVLPSFIDVFGINEATEMSYFWIGMFLVYIVILVYAGFKLVKLNRKYQNME